jgi:DNA-binding transcriptional LysR family regulator
MRPVRPGGCGHVQYIFLIPFGYGEDYEAVKLHQLRYFVTVAEELHFGRAASRLRMAQPPLSRQIRELEDELATRLFNRTSRGVELTDAGRILLEESRTALAQVDRAAQAARRAGQGEIGQLLVGVVPTVDTQVFTRILRTFSARYPSVQVVIRSLNTATQLQGLRTGTLQAGFLRLPVRDDALTIKLVSREPLVAAVPVGHPLARVGRLSLAMLADEPHVIFPRQVAPGYYDLIVSLYREAKVHLRITQEAEHVQTILGLVAGGFGVSVLPATVRNLRPLGVVFRMLTGRLPSAETAVAYRRDDASEVLHAFVAVVERASERLRRRI